MNKNREEYKLKMLLPINSFTEPTGIEPSVAPGPRTGARREAGVPHGALNGTIDRHKDARRVFFLVHERMLKVE